MNLNKHIYYLEQLTGKKVIFIEKETFFVPQDLEGRKEKYLQSIYRLLNQEVIEGDLELENLPIKDLGRVKRVNGNVDIRGCYNLKHLGYLDYVRGNFECCQNRITTLKGSPREVGGDFQCSNNKLISLKGAPEKIKGSFDCSYNDLITLGGAPKEVGRGFYCGSNRLISLKGAPKIVKGDFSCPYNNFLTLEGAPTKVGGDFYCRNNFKKFTEKEVREVCNVEGMVFSGILY